MSSSEWPRAASCWLSRCELQTAREAWLGLGGRVRARARARVRARARARARARIRVGVGLGLPTLGLR